MSTGADFFDGNMRMALNVYRCAHEVGVTTLISCLSTCIFPDNTSYPIDETMIHNGPPHNSNEGYAYAKRMLDILNRTYASQFGRKYTSVIPTNIYGPHDNFHLEHSHLIPGLIHKASIADGPLIVCGTGTPLRQFIYSEDLAKLLVWTLENYDSVEPLILSVGEEQEVSIADVGKLIANEFGKDIVFDTSKSDGQYKKTASNPFKALLPNFEFTPIAEGIHNTVEWFKNNKDIIRK